nr:hypothetical protein RF1 [Scenedesmaceae sp. YH-2023b]
MFTTMSLVTSIKDYIEVVHKLIETDPNFKINTYYDFGSLITFTILSGKEFIFHFFSFQWFSKFWSIPTLIPDIASAMISEISVFDGSFQNTQTLLESPISYGNNNFFIYCIEKFMIGLLNSVFLCLPTSLAHIITLRRFVMQGLEAGFISGLGTIAGNMVWIGSILFGLRFVVIPWLSLDLFRYFLGFVLIVKYMWDSYTERRMVLEDLSKYKIFFLTFLLSFTEQTTIYPFLSNLSLGSDSTLFESFPTENFYQFGIVHSCYLLGIFIGSLSLLQLTCWFWENPAFQIYMWFISSFKTTTSVYSKLVNLTFLYLTMICAISNIAYFGLDYTLTNPLGFVYEDRLLDQKALLETAFLNTKASDRNTRRNRGRHGRRERWKRRVRRYRTFDASLYDQGVYDLLTLEDLNYGFDRFWLRRKIRNHRVRFRFFPGPWMRSFKKQLSRPRLESFMGPRVEFFRILFEQAYHPEFHEFSKKKNILKNQNQSRIFSENIGENWKKKNDSSFSSQNLQSVHSIYWNPSGNKKERFLKQHSTLRKFVRKVTNRIKIAKIQNEMKNPQNLEIAFKNSQNLIEPISSKAWKTFSKIDKEGFTPSPFSSNLEAQSSILQKSENNLLFQRFYKKIFLKNEKNSNVFEFIESKNSSQKRSDFENSSNTLKFDQKIQNDGTKHLSKKERFLERYKTFLTEKTPFQISTGKPMSQNEKMIGEIEQTGSSKGNSLLLASTSKNSFSKEKKTNFRALQNEGQFRSLTFLHPLKFYFQKEQALKRKFQFYGVKLYRNFGVENNAPYFRVMMKRFFYHYKPSLRWERTLRGATMRRARRKSSRIPRKLNIPKSSQILATPFDSSLQENSSVANLSAQTSPLTGDQSLITKPSHFFSLVDKRASRYRYQIYKDVLQHWYYTPLNRFLLKLDVDSFIRRQPNSYFLTKNDEKFLHLKRQLLSEYYETLRWYRYMQHYTTMKNQIGGTKSLSTRAYNQQFVGTFKKIRHLFNITPSFNESTVLKFDQPLYNEYKNSGNAFLFNDSIIHEELLADDLFFLNNENQANIADFKQKKIKNGMNYSPDDLPNQSAKILQEYLITATPLRQEYIQKLLAEKNYWELTKFLFRGQKLRGTNPITNETDFLNQEKDYLLNQNFQTTKFETEKFKDKMWLELFKKCQNKLYDQEALKNYVSLKKEKYENQKQRHEKYLQSRFERMKEAFISQKHNLMQGNEKIQTEYALQLKNLSGYTSSIQKALKESILWEKNSLSSSSFQTIDKFFTKKNFLQKTNIRKNRPNIYSMLQKSNSNLTNFDQKDQLLETSKINQQKMQSLILQKTLTNSFKKRAIQIFEDENKLKETFSNSTNKKLKKDSISFQPITPLKNFFWNTLRFKNFPLFKENTQQTMKNQIKFFEKVLFFSSRSSNKNLDFWKKRESALSKRRKIRKTLKRLRNQKNASEKILFENRDFLIPLSEKTNFQPSRQKNEKSLEEKENKFFKKQQSLQSKSWKKYYSFDSSDSSTLKPFESKRKSFFENVLSFQKNFFTKKFQRKRSRLRRYSSFKGRGPIKKRTLREKFKRQFKSLKKYGASQENSASAQIQLEREKKKGELIQLISQRNFATSPSPFQKEEQLQNDEFLKRDQKQRRTRQMKHRAWKKKKQNFAQKRRKLRKRRRSTIAKIRVFNKKLQRILSKNEVQKWWWQTFFPNFQQTTEKTWQMEKNMQIRKQLFELSEREILERDQMNVFNNNNLSPFQDIPQEKTKIGEGSQSSSIETNFENLLQIGDKDYKPLAMPEAFRIREKLVQKEILHFNNLKTENSPNENSKKLNTSTSLESRPNNNSSSVPLKKSSNQNESFDSKKSSDFFDKFTQNISTPQQNSFSNFVNFPNKFERNYSFEEKATSPTPFNSKFFVGTNPMPFYAGWDESLRKFVVTNRLLSRKGCFSCSSQGMNLLFKNHQNQENLSKTNPEFSKAPLQGMNAATTLYWQIPFTTYDPDQFFALGMDGFSPIGWRNFHFKHSKQTTKPILVKNFFSFEKNSKNLSKNLHFKFLENTMKTKLFNPNTCNTIEGCLNLNEFEKTNNLGVSKDLQKNPFAKLEIDKNFEYRRILKKQKRIKKHPRPPVWFPSGSLSQQVLPVHYIYVFYKRSRLPRDRYIRRRLRSTFFKNQNFSENNAVPKITDFTLRKRVKPRRKYHRKRFLLETNQFLLRRRKFRGFFDENETTRPSSKLFQSSLKQEKRNLQSKQRRKIKDSKQSAENLRVRQLRRRVQRQVFRPIWRYRPRTGGFVWPGDYLRLELVKAPQLNSTVNSNLASVENSGISQPETSQTLSRKIRKKKRRTLQEWQIQPKKYLLEKHNRKVLKRRFEKSINFNS